MPATRNRALFGLSTAVAALGCATALSKEGAKVRVYQTDPTVRDAAASLPAACRAVGTSGPVDQMESERAGADPYRVQRNDAAAHGGNVLLVDSQPLILRPNTDCSPRDQSPQCLEASQSWYRVTFLYYACDAEAVRRLDASAESAPASGPIFSFEVGPGKSGKGASSKGEAARLKARILAMMQEGIGTDVIVAYVRGQRLKRKLTAEDVIDWKKSGIDERVIEAALGG